MKEKNHCFPEENMDEDEVKKIYFLLNNKSLKYESYLLGTEFEREEDAAKFVFSKDILDRILIDDTLFLGITKIENLLEFIKYSVELNLENFMNFLNENNATNLDNDPKKEKDFKIMDIKNRISEKFFFYFENDFSLLERYSNAFFINKINCYDNNFWFDKMAKKNFLDFIKNSNSKFLFFNDVSRGFRTDTDFEILSYLIEKDEHYEYYENIFYKIMDINRHSMFFFKSPFLEAPIKKILEKRIERNNSFLKIFSYIFIDTELFLSEDIFCLIMKNEDFKNFLMNFFLEKTNVLLQNNSSSILFLSVSFYLFKLCNEEELFSIKEKILELIETNRIEEDTYKSILTFRYFEFPIQLYNPICNCALFILKILLFKKKLSIQTDQLNNVYFFLKNATDEKEREEISLLCYIDDLEDEIFGKSWWIDETDESKKVKERIIKILKGENEKK